ncbi:hypothetical protein FJT64_006307 [Amphibalanus amphitrite]|uniref:Nucleic-acid-binding protein from transposon X-element n=1 Tax=Amphibalanus amphitrite TaxID=1232801 RepID=A0A6A4VPL0_AMPAM|nr:hypothetical protein FJT64_006307 [Amphibalanus amphitrite]
MDSAETTDPAPGHPSEEPAELPPSQAIPEGPAFLLITRKEGNFRHTNPFSLRRSIDSYIGPVNSLKALRSGALLIETKTETQTIQMMRTASFRGTPVTISLATRLNSVEGSVRSDALTEITNMELLQELQTQGVVRVQRLRSRDLQNLGPNPTVRLTFSGRILPQAIRCGYLAVPVDPWVPAPRPCTKCWAYGHSKRACRRRQPMCGRCGGPHDAEKCDGPEQCPGCGGPHPAWDRRCPIAEDARQWHRAEVKNRRAEHRAQGHGRPNGATWFREERPDGLLPAPHPPSDIGSPPTRSATAAAAAAAAAARPTAAAAVARPTDTATTPLAGDDWPPLPAPGATHKVASPPARSVPPAPKRTTEDPEAGARSSPAAPQASPSVRSVTDTDTDTDDPAPRPSRLSKHSSGSAESLGSGQSEADTISLQLDELDTTIVSAPTPSPPPHDTPPLRRNNTVPLSLADLDVLESARSGPLTRSALKKQ